MRKYGGYFISFSFLLIVVTNCQTSSKNNYDEIPSMLNIVTNKAQSALEQGYFEKGEQAVLDYIGKKNQNVYKWFTENNYELRTKPIDGYAVVMVCNEGKPIFEDTYCKPGKPDKDHRGNQTLKSCDITMTIKEVKDFCR